MYQHVHPDCVFALEIDASKDVDRRPTAYLSPCTLLRVAKLGVARVKMFGATFKNAVL